MNSGPAHAGKLPAWERLVFAMVLAVMAAFVAAVTMSATGTGTTPSAASAHLPGSVATSTLQQVQQRGGSPEQDGSAAKSGGGAKGGGGSASAALDKRLAVALRPARRRYAGQLAVGVIDMSTGARASYGGSRLLSTASLEKADILAAVLLNHQLAGTPLTSQQAALAVPMIENNDDHAASSLLRLAGGTAGIAAANLRLGLSRTVLSALGRWRRTTTTVADELRLLTDLITPGSPLSVPSRDYELGLMQAARPGQRWGVFAAASAGTSSAITAGWLPGKGRWVVSSMGIVEHAGDQLLIAVLAEGQRTKADGIAAGSAAALAAAGVVTIRS